MWWLLTALCLFAGGEPSHVIRGDLNLNQAESLKLSPFAIRSVQGNVITVEYSGNPSDLWMDSFQDFNPLIRSALTEEVYRHIGDVVDFMVISSNFSYFDFVTAFHVGIKNEVQGIGLDTFDHTATYHSQGRLKALIEVGPILEIPPLDRSWVQLASAIVQHEIGHQWLAYVRFDDGSGTSTHLLKGDDLQHWNYLLDSSASFMYGHRWENTAPSVYRSIGTLNRYSNLDLYLMGLLPVEEVGPIRLLQSATIPPDNALLPVLDQVISADPGNLTVNQIIQVEGPRLPAAMRRPRTFKVAWVHLYSDDEPSIVEVDQLQQMSLFTAAQFQQNTLGLGHLDFRPAVILGELPEVDTDLALSYLQARQIDGLWRDRPETQVRDSVEVATALHLHGVDMTQVLDELEQWQDRSLDDSARIAACLGRFGRDVSDRINSILDQQADDGGFALRPGYASNALDTALAMEALVADGSVAHSQAITEAVAFLLAARRANGLWGQADGTVFETAMVLHALLRQQDVASVELDDAVAMAVAWLQAHQAGHGGFGVGHTDLVATCMVQRALLHMNQADDEAWTHIQLLQNQNGSWQHRVYATALVLNTLSGGSFADLNLPSYQVAFTPNPPIAGQNLNISALVHNQGNQAALDVMADVTLSITGQPDQVMDSQSVTSTLDPQGNASALLSFTVPSDASEFTLTLRTSTSSVDSNLANNSARFSFVLDHVGPDAAIDGSSLQVSNTHPALGETLHIAADVVNLGSEAATDVQLSLYDGDPNYGGTLVDGPYALPALPALTGREQSSLQWVTSGPVGPRSLFLLIESESDQNPSNNFGVITVDVQQPLVGTDIGVDVLRSSMSPLTFESCPQVFSMDLVLVDHGGTQPQDFGLTIYRGEPSQGGEQVFQQTLSFSGPELWVQAGFELAVLRTDDLIAVVTPPAGETDVRPENDRHLFRLPGQSLNDFEVDPGSLQTVPSPMLVQEQGVLRALVRNRNLEPRTGVSVAFRVDSGSGFDLVASRSVHLPGAGTAWVDVGWTPDVATGTAQLQVEVDPSSTVPEIDEDDNLANLTFAIEANPNANLRIQPDSLILSPPPYHEGDPLTVDVLVENTGSVEVVEAQVTLFLDSVAALPLVAPQTLLNVAPQTSQGVQFVVDPIAFRGNHYLVAQAETAQSESTLTDNATQRAIYVTGGPNPAIQSLSLTMDPAWPGDGETVALNFWIENTGALDAEDLLVELRSNSDTGLLLDQRILDLPVGGAPASMSFTAGIDIEELIVLLDPQNTLVEQVETDNRAVMGLRLRDGEIGVDQSVFSPNGDGQRDTVSLFWDLPLAQVDVRLVDRRGAQVAEWLGRPGNGSMVWTGLKTSHVPVDDGYYLFQIRDPETQFVVRSVAVTVDNNASKIRDALRSTDTGFFNVLEPSLNAGDEWVGWTDDSSAIMGKIQSGPVIAVSPDGDSATEIWGSEEFGGWFFLSRAGTPGRYWIRQDNWDGTFTYLLSGLNLQVSHQIVVPYEHEVMAWLVNDRLLIYDPITPQLFLVDYSMDLWEPINWGSHIWENVRHAFVYGNRIWLHEWVGSGASRVEQIVSLDLNGDNARVEMTMDLEQFGRDSETLARSNGYWVLATYDSGMCSEIHFVSLDEAGVTRWRDLFPGEDPDPDAVLTNGTLIVSPEDLGAPLLNVMIDWRTGDRFMVLDDAVDVLRGQISPDDISIASEYPLTDYGIFTNFQNLAARFDAVSLASGAVSLQGTIADANLNFWRVEYAHLAQPDTWIATGLTGTHRVIENYFGVWVPETPGSYLLRLTAFDLGGNQRSQVRLVQIDAQLPFFGVATDHFFISPNADSVKDSLAITFEARNAFEAVVTARDGNGAVQRVMTQYVGMAGPAAMVWDGKDDLGQTVDNGLYSLDLNGVTLYVWVDVSVPILDLEFMPTKRLVEPEFVLETPYLLQVQDANLEQWTLERRPLSGGDWVTVADGAHAYQSDPEKPETQQTVAESLKHEYRLQAFDHAGNQAALTLSPPIAPRFWLQAERSDWAETDEYVANTPLNGVGQVRILATLAPDRYPVTLTSIETAPQLGGPVTVIDDVVADTTQFSGPVIEPGIWPYLLPSEELVYRLQFEDNLGASYRTEWVAYRSLVLGVAVDRLSQQLRFQTSKAFFGTRDEIRLSGELVGIHRGAKLDNPLSLSNLNWRDMQCGGTDLFVALAGTSHWGEQPAPVIDDGTVFELKNVVLRPGEPDEIEFGKILVRDLCASRGIELERVWQCASIPGQWRYRIRKHIPESDLHIQLFADSAGTVALCARTLIGENEELVVDVSGLPADGWHTLYGRIDDGLGQPYAFRAASQDLAQRQALVIYPGPRQQPWTDAVLDVYLSNDPLVVDLPPQYLCPATESEINLYDRSCADTPILRQLTYSYLRDVELPGNWLPHGPVVGATAVPVHGGPEISLLCSDDYYLDEDHPHEGLPWIDIGQLGLHDEWWLTLTFINPSGLCQTETVGLNLSLTQSSGLDGLRFLPTGSGPNALSPNADGIADSLELFFETQFPARINAWIEPQDTPGQVVSLIWPGSPVEPGSYALYWDGTNSQGAVVADGLYRCVVEATTGCGSIATTRLVTVDTQPPTISIESPSSGPVDLPLQVYLSTADNRQLGLVRVETWPDGMPTARSLVMERENPSHWQNQPVADLRIAQAGSYQLQATAVDYVGNEASDVVTMEVSPNPVIASLGTSETWISPNGDGIRDVAIISFELLQPADVTLQIVGSSTFDLITGQTLAAGSYTHFFDGTEQGTPLADGPIQVELIAVTGAVDSASLVLAIDSQPPSINIQDPPEGGISNHTVQSILGSATDAGALAHWLLEFEAAGAARIEIAAGSAEVAGFMGEASDPQDGVNRLFLSATDAAGNRATLVRSFVRDSVRPTVNLFEPLVNQTFQLSDDLEISGEFTEDHPDQLTLELVQGTTVHPLMSWSSGLQVNGSFQFNTPLSRFEEGAYDVRVTLSDRAGNQRVLNRSILLDQNLPVAQINAFSSGYITEPVPVIGSASDLGFDRYLLKLAPLVGGVAGTYSILTIGEQPVEDALLFDWQLLPPDGTYRLRLEVFDGRGQMAVDELDVAINTQPPPIPTGLADIATRVGVPPTQSMEIRLTWDLTTVSDLLGYRVYRDGALMTPTELVDPTWIDAAVWDGVWQYQVSAVDVAGNESPLSDIHERIVDLRAPEPLIVSPTEGDIVGGVVTVIGSVIDPALASWTLAFGTGLAPVAWTQIAQSNQSLTYGVLGTWVTSALAEGDYTLRLQASDTFGNVGQLDIHLYVENTPPSKPGTPTVQENPGNLRVSWPSNPEWDVQAYQVYRNSSLVKTSLSTVYFDFGLPDGTYIYQVIAVDDAGNLSPISDPSAPHELDRHPPHVNWVQPYQGYRFNGNVTLEAFSADNDLMQVAFQVRAQGATPWDDVLIDSQAPWTALWDTSALADGTYELQALATDTHANVDPSPAIITVIKGDVDAPSAVQNLQVLVNADVVTLNWAANAEPDLASYRIYRDGLLIDTIAAPTTSGQYLGLVQGQYGYQVTAVDLSDNESVESGTVTATIFQPTVTTVPTISDQSPVELSGSVRPGFDQLNVMVDAVPQGTHPIQGDGTFTISVILPGPGPYNVSLQASDPLGQTSLPVVVPAVLSELPNQVTALMGIGDGGVPENVDLTWTEPVPAVSGYLIARQGSPLFAIEPLQAAEINSLLVSSGDANALMDGSLLSVWQPQPANDHQVDIQLVDPGALVELEFDWEGTARPTSVSLWAQVQGVWLRIGVWTVPPDQVMNTRVLAGSGRPVVATDWRIKVQGSSGLGLGLRELRIGRQSFLAAPAVMFTDLDPGVGLHEYEVATLNQYGLVAQPGAFVSVGLGDYIPPEAPTNLTASVNGAVVTLDWQASVSPDVASYHVFHNDHLAGQVPSPIVQFVTPPLHRGSHQFAVAAVDLAGNIGSLSNTVQVEIEDGVSAPPVLTGFADPSGSEVVLNWNYDRQTPGFETFRVYRGTEFGTLLPISEAAVEPWIALTYRDRDLPSSGLIYRYRVAAVSDNGWEGFSNELALPVPLGSPVFFAPGVNGSRVNLPADRSRFSGRAEPGTRVRVLRNGFLDGEWSTYPDLGVDESLLLTQEPRALCADSEGQWLAVSRSLAAEVEIHPLDTASSSLWALDQGGYDLAFDPYSRWLALIDRTDPGVGTLRIRNLQSGLSQDFSELGLISGPLVWLDWQHLVAANGSALIRLNASSHQFVNLQTDSLPVVQLARDPISERLLVHRRDGISSVVWSVDPWSPGDANLMWQGAPQTSIHWLPLSGQLMLVDAAGEFQSLRVPSDHQPPTQAPVHIGLIPSYGTVIGIDPGGQFLINQEPGSLARVWRLPGFHDQGVLVGETGLASYFAADGRVWLSYSDSVNTFVEAFHLPGAFTADIDQIESGTSQFQAVAYRPGVGDTSMISDNLMVERDLSHLPDFHLAPESLSTIPRVAVAGNNLLIQLVLSNLGGAPSGDSSVSWSLIAPDGSQTTPSSDTLVSSIPVGGTRTLGFQLSTASYVEGSYTLIASVDAADLVAEGSESNNGAHHTFWLSQTNSVGLDVVVTPDVIDPLGVTSISAEIYNAGPALSAVELTGFIETEDGEWVADFDTLNVGDVASLATATAQWGWDSSSAFADLYRVRVSALSNGTAVAETIRFLTVLGDPEISVTWDHVPVQVDTLQPLQAAFRIHNDSSNVLFATVDWVVRLMDAGGQDVASLAGSTQNLVPAAQHIETVSFVTSALTEPSYIIRVEAWSDGVLYRAIEQLVSVDYTPVFAADASVRVSPPSVVVGTRIPARVTVANRGNQAIDLDMTIELLWDDGAQWQLMTSQGWLINQLDPITSQQQVVWFSTTDLAAGDYHIRAHNDHQVGAPVAIDEFVALELTANQAPRLVLSGLPIAGYTSDNVSPVLEVIDDDDPLPIATMSMNGLPFVSGTLVDQEGFYLIEARVEDSLQQFDELLESFSIDRSAPVIEVIGLVEGGTYGGMVLPYLQITDLNLAGHALELDGSAYQLGTPITAVGPHVLAIEAWDLLGLTSQLSLNFQITEPSQELIRFTGVAHQGAYNTAVLADIELLNGGQLMVFEVDGQSQVAPIQISDVGTHVLHAQAQSSGGGETQDIYAQITLDFTAPQILVRGVIDGQHANHTVTPVILVDGVQALSSQCSLNGVPFESGTTIGVDGFYTLVITAVDAAGNQAGETIDFVIDSQPPLIQVSGVSEGQTFTGPVVASWLIIDDWLASQTAKLNGQAVSSPLSVQLSGNYVLDVTAVDQAGNRSHTAVNFSLNNQGPLVYVTGVRDGDVVQGPVTVEYGSDDVDLVSISATLDGAPFSSGSVIQSENEYSLVVTAMDALSNQTVETLAFALDRTAPQITISGVAQGGQYNQAVSAHISSLDLHPLSLVSRLDGVSYVSGTAISVSGNHLLQVDAVDQAGNASQQQVSFSITQAGAPSISITGVENGNHYATSVTPTFEVSGQDVVRAEAWLSGQPFTSGTLVDQEQSYLLVVEAETDTGLLAREQVSFTLDFTAPSIQVTNLTQGATYAQSVIPDIQIQDPWLMSESYWLDGLEYVPGTSIASNGAHQLHLLATDRAGNSAELLLDFFLDLQEGLRVVPETLYFGNVFLSGSATQMLTIHNFTFEAVDLLSWTFTGPQASHFTIQETPAGQVNRESSIQVVVAMTASQPGSFAGELQITTSSAEYPLLVVPLSGVFSETNLAFDPQHLYFGEQLLGSAGTASFKLQNLSLLDLDVLSSSTTIGHGTISTNLNTPTNLASQGTANGSLEWQPASTGAALGELVVNSTDPLSANLVAPLCGYGSELSSHSVVPGSQQHPIHDLWAGIHGSDLYLGRGSRVDKWTGASAVPYLDWGLKNWVDELVVAAPDQTYLVGKPHGLFAYSNDEPEHRACSKAARLATYHQPLASVLVIEVDQDVWLIGPQGVRQIQPSISLDGVTAISVDESSGQVICAAAGQILTLDVETGLVTVAFSDPSLVEVKALVWTPERLWMAQSDQLIELVGMSQLNNLFTAGANVMSMAVSDSYLYYLLEEDSAVYRTDRFTPFQVVDTPLAHDAVRIVDGCLDNDAANWWFLEPSEQRLVNWNPATNQRVTELSDPALANMDLLAWRNAQTLLALNQTGDIFEVDLSGTLTLSLLGASGLANCVDLLADDTQLWALTPDALYVLDSLGQATQLRSWAFNAVQMGPHPSQSDVIRIADASDYRIWEYNTTSGSLDLAFQLEMEPESFVCASADALWLLSQGRLFRVDSTGGASMLGPYPIRSGRLIGFDSTAGMAVQVDEIQFGHYSVLPVASIWIQWRSDEAPLFLRPSGGSLSVLDLVKPLESARDDMPSPLLPKTRESK